MVAHRVTVIADGVAAPYVVAAGRQIGVEVSVAERPAIQLPSAARVVIAARSASGQGVAYPCARVTSDDGRWRSSSVVLDGGLSHVALNELARANCVGLWNVVFDSAGELVDLVAGSGVEGLWTVDATLVGHCENQVRAMLDLPLGAPDLLAPEVASRAARPGLVKDPTSALLHCYARDPRLRVHLPTAGPLAVVTAIGRDGADVARRVRHAADYLEGVDA